MTSDEPKQCSRCKEYKERTDFYAEADAPDGHQYHCKQCDNKRRFEHRLRNWKHETDREREYQQSRRDKLKRETRN